MGFFISPSPILLSLLCISVTHASPLDSAALMINNTQVTGPQGPGTDAGETGFNSTILIWLSFSILVGTFILLRGFCVIERLSNGVGIGLAAVVAGKLIETKYQ